VGSGPALGAVEPTGWPRNAASAHATSRPQTGPAEIGQLKLSGLVHYNPVKADVTLRQKSNQKPKIRPAKKPMISQKSDQIRPNPTIKK
jgi:hypothetical protein